MAGAAPSLAAGQAGSLPAQVGEMQMIVAYQARALEPEPPFAGRWLDHANGRVPVDADDPFALAPFDQHVVAVHGGEER